MKLNEKGWGIQAMIIMVFVLMICLIIVAVLAQSIFKDILKPTEPNTPTETTKTTYKQLEEKVNKSLKQYQETYYKDLLDGEEIEVKVTTLQKNNMLDKLIDKNDKECSGYGEIKYKDEKYSYKAYIKCSDYKTKGYIED